jgi:hypothetical protein
MLFFNRGANVENLTEDSKKQIPKGQTNTCFDVKSSFLGQFGI